MSEKATGYSLLGIGIIIMIFTTIQIITVFTGKAKPIKFFQYDTPTTTSISSSSSGSLNPAELLQQLQGGSGELNLGQMPGMQLFDPNMINDILNVTIYYFIMMFLLNFGFKLASLGTQLLRPIQVNFKNRSMIANEEQDKSNS